MWDESGSMDTEDILIRPAELTNGTISRRDSIQSIVDPKRWESFTDEKNPDRLNIDNRTIFFVIGESVPGVRT